MRLILLVISFCVLMQTAVFAGDVANLDNNTISQQSAIVSVYSEKGKFGLKKDNGDVVTKPIYKKLIKVGNTSWIALYKTKYGLIDANGDFLILPKYRNVDRIRGKYVKFGNDNDYGLYDEYGNTIIQPEYSSIDMLYGNMFLTCKDYRYGVVDIDGNTILENEFDDIYMPKSNVMMVQYAGNWCSIETVSGKEVTLPFDLNSVSGDKDFKITNLVVNTGVVSGYSVVTLTDYVIKLLSSISPAYEATIDELMFSQGAETISIFMRLSWIPKFPFVYVKHYYKIVRCPNNGPLVNTRNSLKKQMR